MGQPYSQDLREQVVDTAGATSHRQAAKRFGVGPVTAVCLMTALATTGIVAARPQERARRSKLDPHKAFLRGLIAARDDMTLGEMRVRLREEHALGRARDPEDFPRRTRPDVQKRQPTRPSRIART